MLSKSSAPKGGADAAGEPAIERALVGRVKQGDQDAYQELVRLHVGRAYAVAYRVAGSRDDAEDLVQEGFMAALEHIDRFDPDRPFAPWLHRIIVNRGLSIRRANRRREDGVEMDEQTSRAPSPATLAERSEVRERFDAALATLPERQRLAVELHDVDGFTAEEIGTQLNVAAGTVRWYIHQARRSLRSALGMFHDPDREESDASD